MKNQLSDVRDHLFATLESLRDEDSPMEVDRALAIASVAKEINASAKHEIDYLRVTGATKGSGFIAAAVPQEIAPATTRAALPAGSSTDTPLRVCDNCKQRTERTPCHNCGAAWKRS